MNKKYQRIENKLINEKIMLMNTKKHINPFSYYFIFIFNLYL